MVHEIDPTIILNQEVHSSIIQAERVLGKFIEKGGNPLLTDGAHFNDTESHDNAPQPVHIDIDERTGKVDHLQYILSDERFSSEGEPFNHYLDIIIDGPSGITTVADESGKHSVQLASGKIDGEIRFDKGIGPKRQIKALSYMALLKTCLDDIESSYRM